MDRCSTECKSQNSAGDFCTILRAFFTLLLFFTVLSRLFQSQSKAFLHGKDAFAFARRIVQIPPMEGNDLHSGWQSILARKLFLCSSWVPARKLQRTWSSTPCSRSWPPFCLPLFTSDGLNLDFYALTAHFGQWLKGDCRGQKARQWQVAAGLIYGQVKKCSRRRKLVRVTHVMRLGTQADLKIARPRTGPLWAAKHGLYRAGESDRPSCSGSFGTPHLGHSEARSTTPHPSGMVAS
jgi:hypothetical protein